MPTLKKQNCYLQMEIACTENKQHQSYIYTVASQPLPNSRRLIIIDTRANTILDWYHDIVCFNLHNNYVYEALNILYMYMIDGTFILAISIPINHLFYYQY